MKTYVAGQNHSPWRVIAKYYIKWWKNGKKPQITEDQVVFWYRVHAKSAQCNEGSSTIRNKNMLEDSVFAWAAVTRKSTISMSLGSNKRYDFDADASGPAVGSVPFPEDLGNSGKRSNITIIQNNKTAYQGSGSKPITPWCSTKNFNPVVDLVGQGDNDRGHA
jgi:glucan endo-1,3-alpha-glucosidase